MSIKYEKNKILIIGIICFLFLLPLIIFKVIDLSKSNEVEKKTFSIPTSEVKSLKEKVVGASGIKNSNGIYYYNGTNVNNNLLFAEKCWQIVRTTDNDGVKIIYNGEPVNGICGSSAYGTTSYVNYIGTDASIYNSNANLLTSVGYMYGDYEYGKVNFYTDEQNVGFNGYFGSGGAMSYYYGTSAIWNESTKRYTLENELKGGANMNMALSHKYTCGSTSAGASCEVVYVAEGGTSTASYVSLPPGKSYTALDYFKIIDGFENASVASQGTVEWLFSDGVYYNSSTKTFDLHHTNNASTTSNTMVYDMAGWSSSSTAFNNYHYTCFTTEKTVSSVSLLSTFPESSGINPFFAGVDSFYNVSNSTLINTPCTELYYIFYSGNSGLYYLKLDNTMNATDINNILNSLNSGTYLDGNLLSNNSKNSSIKNVVDSWYNTYFGTSSYKKYIVDDVYVNDRNLASGGGWINRADLTKNITFNTYNGVTTSFSTEDKFSLSNGSIDSSNKALTAPVGLLSYDEAILAGVTSTTSSYLGTRPFWLMSPHSYVEEASTTGASYDMVSYVYSVNNGLTSSAVNSANYVRPVISVSADIPVAGTGTETDPYRLVDSFSVTYSFSGDYPDVAVPTGGDYAEGSEVSIDTSITVGQKVNGYIFNGWSSSDVTISNNKFTMPTNNVSLVGTWNRLVLPELTIEPYIPKNNRLGNIYFIINVSNPYDFAINNVKVEVNNPVCVSSTTCSVSGNVITIESIVAGGTYTFRSYVVADDVGVYSTSAKIVGVSGENLTFDVYNATLVSASASTVASLKVCSYVTGGSNGSVAQFELFGSNVLNYENNPYIYSFSYFSSDFTVLDNNCVEYYLGTNYEYYILQRDRMEYSFDFVSGLIDEDEEYFTLEPKKYEINYYYNYENKKYFHSWDRKENDIEFFYPNPV